MKKIVTKCMGKTKGQIGASKPGILVIGSSCPLAKFIREFEKAIKSTLRNSGRRHPGIAGVALVALNEIGIRPMGWGQHNFYQRFEFSVAKNPYYFKDNPLLT
jgi:hypothetical protein